MLTRAETVVKHFPSFLFCHFKYEQTNHVVTKNFAEYVTESRTILFFFFFLPSMWVQKLQS